MGLAHGAQGDPATHSPHKGKLHGTKLAQQKVMRTTRRFFGQAVLGFILACPMLSPAPQFERKGPEPKPDEPITAYGGPLSSRRRGQPRYDAREMAAWFRSEYGGQYQFSEEKQSPSSVDRIDLWRVSNSGNIVPSGSVPIT